MRGGLCPHNGHHILQIPVAGAPLVDVILLGRYCERFADHAVETDKPARSKTRQDLLAQGRLRAGRTQSCTQSIERLQEFANVGK